MVITARVLKSVETEGRSGARQEETKLLMVRRSCGQRRLPQMRSLICCRGLLPSLLANTVASVHLFDSTLPFLLPTRYIAQDQPTSPGYTMAKKQSTPQPATPRAPAQNTPSKPAPPPSSTKQTTAPASNTPKITSTTLSQRSSPQEIAIHVWNKYVQDTPSRTLLLDCFLLYIALNGAVQFIYCIIGGNYVCSAPGLLCSS